MITTHNNKKEIFSELSDQIYLKDIFDHINEIKISSLKNHKILEELKSLNIIEINKIENFLLYINYDHFLIFKLDNDYYFCNTELVPILGEYSMIKIIDFKQYLRKDKILKINISK